jgi:putative membrane protein
MHIGKSYGIIAFLRWTRRKALMLAASATVVTALYQLAGWHALALPWPVLAMLGTAASFIVGFKNAQTYGRTAEGQQIWSAITASSRYWGLISRDFPVAGDAGRALVNRHLAWLTAVRYQLREPRVWEAATHKQNAEYQDGQFTVAEHVVPLQTALEHYLPRGDVAALMQQGGVPMALMAQQSASVRDLYTRQELAVLHYTEMQKTLKDFIDQHARAERLKNFPYPRQYAIVNTLFVWSFALLLPLGLVKDYAWLAVPCSVLLGWMYVALDQVGESTDNPFEGGANDVPITHLCGIIACDLRTLLGECNVPPVPVPAGAIVL